MAMDDIYRLVQAVLIDGRMTRPTYYGTKNQPVGKWREAKVLDACVSGNHSNGFFNGYVRFVLDGEEYAQDATFHELWKQGWTSYEVRDRYLAETRRPRRRSVDRKRRRK